MDAPLRLQLIARKLSGADQDIRHALLDVSADFLAVAANLEDFPALLHDEVQSLAAEVLRVQPRFPSHRETSVLFDREGLGMVGKQTARELAQRIRGVQRLATPLPPVQHSSPRPRNRKTH